VPSLFLFTPPSQVRQVTESPDDPCSPTTEVTCDEPSWEDRFSPIPLEPESSFSSLSLEDLEIHDK